MTAARVPAGSALRPRRLRARRLLSVGLVGALVACAPADRREPVPDETLYAAVEALPHVVSADLRWNDTFNEGKHYEGEVVVDDEADPVCVLDQVLGILWQGRDGLTLVTVRQGDRVVEDDALGLSVGGPTLQELTKRYGPRPSDGVLVETKTPPTCR